MALLWRYIGCCNVPSILLFMTPADGDGLIGEDVTQNVLFRLTTRLPNFKYDRTKSFRGWLKTLTHHAWHDFITEAL